MAALSGTTQTYDNIGLREDLSDVIFDLFPEDTCVSRTSTVRKPVPR